MLLASTTGFGVFGGSLIIGLAICWLALNVQNIVKLAGRRIDAPQDFDTSRRKKIAKHDSSYRSFYPLLIEMTSWIWLRKMVSFDRVRKNLNVGVEAAPWKNDEFVVTKTFDVLLQAVILTMILIWFKGIQIGVLVGVFYSLCSILNIERSLKQRADLHRKKIDQRLPYTIDLMALMMSAGATIHETIPIIVRETQGHPVSREFQRLQAAIEGGANFEEALLELRERIGTDAVSELAVVVKQGVAQGTPLADSFLSLADQMRLRRSQNAEKAAGKAQTMITFPAMLVMTACLIIIVAPFAVSVMGNGF